MQNSKNNEEHTLGPGEVISRSLPLRLLIVALVLFVVFSLLSSLYLYSDMYKPLSTHYSAIVSILNDIHETLLIKTLKINALFFLLAFAGILILGIIYTNRVCGPLYRVKFIAKSVAEGRLDTLMRFRQKDAVKSFAGIFNNMTRHYSDKISGLNNETGRLNKTLTHIKALAEEGKVSESDMQKAHEINRRIKDILKTIKL